MSGIYTKTGDKGETGLLGGSRISKSSPRVNCYGTIDEANSILGLAYSLTEDKYIKETIYSIQKRLFLLAGEIASDKAGGDLLKNIINEEDIKFLEAVIDRCYTVTGKQTSFVIPGKNTLSSALHMARTVVRRAERLLVNLAEEEEVRRTLLIYVNRLSDGIYALARLEETYEEEKALRKQVEALVRERFGIKNKESSSFDLCLAEKMAANAEKIAEEMRVPIVFSAVDNGGNIILVHRMEGALLGSIDISINKAYTANAFHMATDELGALAGLGKPLYGIENTNSGRIVIFGGGFPLKREGLVVGAIGVSGGTVQEDMEIGRYAIKCLQGDETFEY